jgi:hypothetical protein
MTKRKYKRRKKIIKPKKIIVKKAIKKVAQQKEREFSFPTLKKVVKALNLREALKKVNRKK